jgi:hypothetical protein
MTAQRWQTVPLFGAAVDFRETPTPRRRNGRSPRDLVLHIYWSGGVEAHALGSLAARTPYPDQQRALWDLQTLEVERKELAAQTLEAIWGVKLPRSPANRKAPRPGIHPASGRTRKTGWLQPSHPNSCRRPDSSNVLPVVSVDAMGRG